MLSRFLGFALLVLVLAATSFPVVAFAKGRQAEWKTFQGRAGWTIDYPSSFHGFSCHNCPTDGYSFMSFAPPGGASVFMVSPVADRPGEQAADQWLMQLSTSLNLNPVIDREWITLDGARALKVITQNNADPGHPVKLETVYVVHGERSFELSFEQSAATDATFRKMLDSFRFTTPHQP